MSIQNSDLLISYMERRITEMCDVSRNDIVAVFPNAIRETGREEKNAYVLATSQGLLVVCALSSICDTITKTRPCNIQQFFKPVKVTIFI